MREGQKNKVGGQEHKGSKKQGGGVKKTGGGSKKQGGGSEKQGALLYYIILYYIILYYIILYYIEVLNDTVKCSSVDIYIALTIIYNNYLFFRGKYESQDYMFSFRRQNCTRLHQPDHIVCD